VTEDISLKSEATEEFAGFVETVAYDQLPGHVVDLVKKSILDTIGIILPASFVMPPLAAVLEMMKEAGGKKESTILGDGAKVPCWSAAFANGMRAHVLDYADGHLEAILRVGPSVIPPALAIAERRGGVSGRDFIAACAVGEEVICRLGVAVARRRRELGPWHGGVLFGNFGATAAASRLLGLSREKINRAFGIGFIQCAGTLDLTSSIDSNLRGMYPGFVGQTGVQAALMADRGILGPRGCLESKYGLLRTYFRGEYDRDALLGDLGAEFQLSNLSFKPWPACALAHPYIDATLNIVGDNRLTPGSIKKINVFCGDIGWDLCDPIEKRRAPSAINDAKYSIPFCVAVAAAKGKVANGDFTPEALKDREVLKMARKVKAAKDPALNKTDEETTKNQLPPARVEITVKNGKVFAKRVDFPYGHHLRPMKTEDLIAKFKDCASFSPKPISAKNVDRAVNTIMSLEQTDDVADIVRLLK
jgi:2-methylcitrate dehydratase PrpD